MQLGDSFAAFCAAHGGRPPRSSAFYELVGREWNDGPRVARALLRDAALHRVHLPLELMVGLVAPRNGCGGCGGTGARHVAGGRASICPCVGGSTARTWVAAAAPPVI
jgi:hypothetical protein